MYTYLAEEREQPVKHKTRVIAGDKNHSTVLSCYVFVNFTLFAFTYVLNLDKKLAFEL